ncbi:MAG: PQQ-binding-like beta-propeller repeat protein, partial [Phycisphaerae bacterium]|nr:PQQ-binding-like beta-propeller repeat protein [Phycisphaerae bacterium]
MRLTSLVRATFCVALVFSVQRSLAADWPQWRYDANRSAASPANLPPELHLHWVRQYPALEPAWEDPINQDRMPFDRAYEPIVIGQTLVVGSNRNDRVTALDTRTGAEKWRFYADGPVRFPPAAWKDNLYFVSDDGCLYCLDVQRGSLRWKIHGGAGARKILGNSRLISAWPARGGPVVADGVVYFGASIWPFMGAFVHALDAQTGKTVWTNDGSGPEYTDQPHGGAIGFGNIAPQGAIAAVGDRLIVPCGRSVPACLDRRTGEILYYHLSGSKGHQGADSPSRKLEGGSHVSAVGNVYFNHRGLNTAMYDLATGKMYTMWTRKSSYPAMTNDAFPVLAPDVCYFAGNAVVARGMKDLKRADYKVKEKSKITGRQYERTKYRWDFPTLWECNVDATGALIKSGDRLYAGGKDVVSAVDVSKPGKPNAVWSAKIQGMVARIVAADDRLFVVTLEGRLYAFGPDKTEPKMLALQATTTPTAVPESKLAADILKHAPVDKGVCLVFGLKTGRLAEALAAQSDFTVVAVDPDPTKVADLRKRLDDAGTYGKRIAAQVGDPTTFQAPPYIAAVTLVEDLPSAGFDRPETALKAIYASMRPYGGLAYLPIADKKDQDAFASLARTLALPGAKVTLRDGHVLLTREGPLPGADDWTHQYGDSANTVKSDDAVVRAPLGLLWFGGNTHHDVLPRHGHGPPEQILGGRLFIEGNDVFSARDVYTGQVLWRRSALDLGTFGVYYDSTYKDNPFDTTYNQVHIPGANARGSNFVVTADRVYLLAQEKCLVLDATNGKTLATFSLPAKPGAKDKPKWGYIGAYKDWLIA